MPLPYLRTLCSRVARWIVGSIVERPVALGGPGYRTRVSANRGLAGCATARLVVIDGSAGKHPKGVHVARGPMTHRKRGFDLPDSA
jgi:hypothetical protein